MPTLRFHAVTMERLFPVSNSLLNDLMSIYKVPVDHINLEIIESKFIVEGKLTEGFPVVEISAFQRPYAMEDAVARSVSAHLVKAGYPESEVYFLHLSARSYYGNGSHFGGDNQ